MSYTVSRQCVARPYALLTSWSIILKAEEAILIKPNNSYVQNNFLVKHWLKDKGLFNCNSLILQTAVGLAAKLQNSIDLPVKNRDSRKKMSQFKHQTHYHTSDRVFTLWHERRTACLQLNWAAWWLLISELMYSYISPPPLTPLPFYYFFPSLQASTMAFTISLKTWVPEAGR